MVRINLAPLRRGLFLDVCQADPLMLRMQINLSMSAVSLNYMMLHEVRMSAPDLWKN